VETPGFSFAQCGLQTERSSLSEEIFARRIYQQRKGMGLSLREIARVTGISASTISRIENGRLSPTLDVATKLAMALNLEPPATSQSPAATHSEAQLDAAATEKISASPPQIVVYRKLAHMLLRGGIRRNLSKIAARNGYEMALLLRGTLQLRTIDGFRENLKPGATINAKLIAKHTYFAIAAEEAELLWIG
jgi:transcriptional regulator with XRE-family HTH domain